MSITSRIEFALVYAQGMETANEAAASCPEEGVECARDQLQAVETKWGTVGELKVKSGRRP